MNSLENIFDKIQELKQSNSYNNELDWNNYEFGKNFYLNVSRNNIQTEYETKFIIDKLRLKVNSNILDLGCGGGRNAFELAEKGFKVTGIDLNKYAIEQAKTKKIENNLEINFICQDISDIDYNEEFNAALLIFNHFSSFSFNQAKKVLKKIEKALSIQGKLLIEISSPNHLMSLHGLQEWAILDSWISGNFKQLVLIDNIFDSQKEIHIRKDYCLRLSDGQIFEYTQTTYLYDLENIHKLLKSVGLKLVQAYGDWQGKIYDESDENLILLIQK